MEKLNLLGRRFGRWSVISAVIVGGRQRWLCQCDCAAHTERYVQGSSLTGGKSTSCGCIAKEKASARATHGMSSHPLYWRWVWMRDRCERETAIGYEGYGGRGIRVCDRWQSFENFRDDMGATFEPHLTIERIDNDGDYEPGNCEWIAGEFQARNRRNTIWLDVGDQRYTLTDVARLARLSRTSVYSRVKNGKIVDESLLRLVRERANGAGA